MYPKQITPGRVIINAVVVGFKAYIGVWVLQHIPFALDQIDNQLNMLTHLCSHCSVHVCHDLHQSWPDKLLEFLLGLVHAAIIFGAVVCSAIYDLRKLLKDG